MEVLSISPRVQTHFRSVEETKRSEAPKMVNNSTLIENKVENENLKTKFKYNWKTISAITGAAAVVLLGIANRHSISKVFKNISKKKVH